MNKQIKSKKEPRIKVMPTDKFKTTLITFKFMAPLDEETMTSRSLLSKLLVRATKKWPTDKAFNRKLSELYGAYVNSFVTKFKDKHVITITLELVNERYLKHKDPLFDEGLSLLKEILYHPIVEDERFNETFVQQEKTLLKKKLEAVNDNKSQLAFLKLMENMFGNQPYSYLASGLSENISKVTPESLYHTYQSMLENDDCAVYVVGNVDSDIVKQKIANIFHIQPLHQVSHVIQPQRQVDELPQTIIEHDELDQAKLNIGFRFPTYYGEPDYYTFVVFNTMFGGDPSSVLFNEVREKQSLTYSIRSQIDGKNGYMFVLSGVAVDKYERAKDTIIDEFKKFQQGEFTEEKLELAKKILISQRNESQDRPKSMVEIAHNQILLPEDLTNGNYGQKIHDVTKDDIINLTKRAILDTIYVLTKEDEAL
ncbi:insulinase family protein [Staphylococcus debuckii]|nr:insulinase family protein [Staphylococcus debuckii]